jgi:hypothetical protein
VTAPRLAAQPAVEVSSLHYGADQVRPIAKTLEGLIHGPELDRLSVYVATPEEIASICGPTVLACYQPELERMIVSGVDRSSGGVPRDFAIAHEYGHHIANSQEGAIYPAIDVGTTRWATYERVCQFTRARKLFPGDQGNHYFEDPEEAFAESYAHLNDPEAKVSWQYASFLRPTPESLKKIRKDIAKPWRGPVTSTLRGDLAEPSPVSATHRHVSAGSTGVDSAVVVGSPPWLARRTVETPLDGEIAVSLQAPAGADFVIVLRDTESGRVVSRATTGEGGVAEVSYANCGASELRLEVRSLRGSGPFVATVLKP